MAVNSVFSISSTYVDLGICSESSLQIWPGSVELYEEHVEELSTTHCADFWFSAGSHKNWGGAGSLKELEFTYIITLNFPSQLFLDSIDLAAAFVPSNSRQMRSALFVKARCYQEKTIECRFPEQTVGLRLCREEGSRRSPRTLRFVFWEPRISTSIILEIWPSL